MSFSEYGDHMGVMFKDLTFSSLVSNQQVFLQNIFSLEMRNLTFNPTNSTKALYGGSIFCENCIDFRLYESSFVGQESLLMGGALYLT